VRCCLAWLRELGEGAGSFLLFCGLCLTGSRESLLTSFLLQSLGCKFLLIFGLLPGSLRGLSVQVLSDLPLSLDLILSLLLG